MEIQELIKACVEKKPIAQKQLYETFAPKMLGVCMRYMPSVDLAEDVLQDAFIKVFLNINKYKQEAPIEAWIRRIVVNTALNNIRDHLRKRMNDKEIDESFDQLKDESGGFETLTMEVLLKALQLLPDGYRTVFNLYEIEGYSHKEIGDALHISETTSRSQLAKAKKYLTTKLLNKEDFI